MSGKADAGRWVDDRCRGRSPWKLFSVVSSWEQSHEVRVRIERNWRLEERGKGVKSLYRKVLNGLENSA